MRTCLLRRPAALLVAVAVAASSVPQRALAQTAAEIAAARELFEEGLKLEDKGQWAEALERFRKVAAVKMTPAVRFHIALCLENTGKLVDALVEFQRAQSDAANDPTQANVAANAGKHVADLKERIPRLIVKLPDGVEGATLTIDGAPVASSLVGSAIPLDPGAHKVSVQAPKRTTFTKDVELVERGKVLTLEAVLPAAPETGGDEPPPPKDPPPDPGTSSGVGPLPWIFGGLGVAALAGGGAMFLLRQGTIKDLEDMCGPTRTSCPESARSTFDKGRTYTTYGNILLGVGAVSLATAVVLFIVAPSPSAREPKAASKPAFSFSVAPGSVGVSFAGAF